MRFNPFTRMLTVVALGVACAAGAARFAAANDLSTLPCTAGDVEIVGNGLVLNEPCTCTAGSTFNAQVQFTVRNNTSTGRYCIALHLVPDGSYSTTPIDIVLRDANGSSTAPGKSGSERFHDTVMYGTLPNFPCSIGIVTFGSPGVTRGKCLPGQCTTISWNTSGGAASCTTADQSPPGGQCRHQQVTIVGYGATLACTAGCTPGCGGTTTLRACVTAPTSRGPFSLVVTGSDGSTATQSTFGDASGTACLDFTVSPSQSPTTTYTLTVTDKDGCTRTATQAINVTALTVTITPPSTPGCNGVLSYSASATGGSGCSFTWTVDGQSLATFLAGGGADAARIARTSGSDAASFDFRALDNACHTIGVSCSCPTANGTCTGSTSVTAKQCVGSTLNCTP